jgi:hypothetical protein
VDGRQRAANALRRNARSTAVITATPTRTINHAPPSGLMPNQLSIASMTLSPLSPGDT